MPTTPFSSSSPVIKLRPTIQRRRPKRRNGTRRRRPSPVCPVGQQRRTNSTWTEGAPSSPASISTSPSSSSSSSQSPPQNATSLDSSQHLSSAEFREMRRLASLLPAHLQVHNPQAQPALLVNNAAQYIAQLTATVLARVHNGSLPKEVLDQLVLPASPSGMSTNANIDDDDSSAPIHRRRRRHARGGRHFWQPPQL